jgi:hypothetical protein
LTAGTGATDPEHLKAFEALIPMRRMGQPDDMRRAVSGL